MDEKGSSRSIEDIFPKVKKYIGLFPTMGFLTENDSSAYFAILGELPSSLSFTVGFFKTLCFLSLLVGFFRGQETTYLATPNVLVGLRPNIRRQIFWLSALNLKDRCIYVQNSCHLCPKRGLHLAKKLLCTLVIQDTNVIVGLKLLTTRTNVTTVFNVHRERN